MHSDKELQIGEALLRAKEEYENKEGLEDLNFYAEPNAKGKIRLENARKETEAEIRKTAEMLLHYNVLGIDDLPRELATEILLEMIKLLQKSNT